MQSGLSVVVGNDGRRPEDRSFVRYPFLRTALQWYWSWLLDTYFGLYRASSSFVSSSSARLLNPPAGAGGRTSTCRAGSPWSLRFFPRRTSAGGSRGDWSRLFLSYVSAALLPLLFFPRRFCSSAPSMPPIAPGVSSLRHIWADYSWSYDGYASS